jgi:hypothetical protein
VQTPDASLQMTPGNVIPKKVMLVALMLYPVPELLLKNGIEDIYNIVKYLFFYYIIF